MSTNGKTAREIWTERLEIERRQAALYRVMREALAPLEGKVVNKRFAAVAQAHFDKALPGVHVYYRDAYGTLALGISLHQAPADMRLGYNDTPEFGLCEKNGADRRRFTLAEFDKRNASYGRNANERIAKREALLATDEPESIHAEAVALSQAFDAYRERVDALPDAYALDELPMLKRTYVR